MIKILVELWDKNKNRLEQALRTYENIEYIDYKTLVKVTFDNIYNYDNAIYVSSIKYLDCDNLTEIDDGDYQGTLIYLIPFKTYQPSEYEYLMTYVRYGSCSVCDTLLSITDYIRGTPTDENIKDLMALCKDIVTNTIRPYNIGWRYDDIFDIIDY